MIFPTRLNLHFKDSPYQKYILTLPYQANIYWWYIML